MTAPIRTEPHRTRAVPAAELTGPAGVSQDHLPPGSWFDSARMTEVRDDDPRAPGGSALSFFYGFDLERVELGEGTVRVRHGGSGPAVVLLHGHPRTHTTWHRVAPLLADRFTVVCPDLRGYGESSKPTDEPDHAQASKRAMAGDAVRLMRALGH